MEKRHNLTNNDDNESVCILHSIVPALMSSLSLLYTASRDGGWREPLFHTPSTIYCHASRSLLHSIVRRRELMFYAPSPISCYCTSSCMRPVIISTTLSVRCHRLLHYERVDGVAWWQALIMMPRYLVVV